MVILPWRDAPEIAIVGRCAGEVATRPSVVHRLIGEHTKRNHRDLVALSYRQCTEGLLCRMWADNSNDAGVDQSLHGAGRTRLGRLGVGDGEAEAGATLIDVQQVDTQLDTVLLTLCIR